MYRAADDTWFVLIVTPDKLAAVAKAIGRADLLTDPRFSDPAKLMANMPQLTAILDEVFGSQPMAHWYEVFNGVHVTFGAVRGPQEVINDPQLRANDIVVPLEGAGGKLTSTISSPIQVHGVAKVPAKRAPGLGEHNEEDPRASSASTRPKSSGLRASGAIPKAKAAAVACSEVQRSLGTMATAITSASRAVLAHQRPPACRPGGECSRPSASSAIVSDDTATRRDRARARHRRSQPQALRLLRIHSQCFTGEMLGSLRCDCARPAGHRHAARSPKKVAALRDLRAPGGHDCRGGGSRPETSR